MLPSILYSIFLAGLASLPWGMAFGAAIGTSLSIGLVTGIIVGILVSLFGELAHAGGNITRGETTFVNNAILTMFGVVTIGSGVLAWLVRLIFF